MSYNGLTRAEVVQMIRDAQATNKSAGALAFEIGGGVTRNMIIGLAHREKLKLTGISPAGPMDPEKVRMRAEAANRTRQRNHDRIVAERQKRSEAKAEQLRTMIENERLAQERVADMTAQQSATEVISAGIHIEDLERGQCKWPLWGFEKTDRANHRCCGNPVGAIGPYCQYHARVSGSGVIYGPARVPKNAR